MAIDVSTLDAHEQPSEYLKSTWKAYSRTDHKDFINHDDIDDLSVPEKFCQFKQSGSVPAEKLKSACKAIESDGWNEDQVVDDAPIYYHPLLPGLLVIPSMIPPSTQKALLSHVIHRDLSNPTHQTNLNLHYNLPYQEDENHVTKSFFSLAKDSSEQFMPKDASVHKPLNIKQVLERRLSWVTLGGQYDWSNRVYPGQKPPEFPGDIAKFLHTLFPETTAQAAIVNFYSPGDTMMMHRDVSEEIDKGLVSLSMGCDALFMIAPNDYDERKAPDNGESGRKPYLLLRLRSGDAIYMSDGSRFAWHGVPKVLKDTCPEFLQDWPAEDGKYEEWRGWMKTKRININVRQMK